MLTASPLDSLMRGSVPTGTARGPGRNVHVGTNRPHCADTVHKGFVSSTWFGPVTATPVRLLPELPLPDSGRRLL